MIVGLDVCRAGQQAGDPGKSCSSKADWRFNSFFLKRPQSLVCMVHTYLWTIANVPFVHSWHVPARCSQQCPHSSFATSLRVCGGPGFLMSSVLVRRVERAWLGASLTCTSLYHLGTFCASLKVLEKQHYFCCIPLHPPIPPSSPILGYGPGI